MKDKDKEAFDEWLSDANNHYVDALAYEFERHLCFVSWKAACEYKDAENKKLQENILLLQEKTLVLGEFEDENKKLRDALNILRQNLKWDHGNSEIIREALEEAGEE